MRSRFAVLLIASLAAACTSSSDGDGDASTSSGAGAQGGGGDPGGGGGQGGEGAPTQNAASLLAWQAFQGAFDSIDQVPRTEDGPSVPPPATMVGCAVDAPEIGERVVYIERSPVEGSAVPHRQILVAFEAAPDPEITPHPGSGAIGTLYEIVDPRAWAGRCEPPAEMPRLGDVSRDASCSFLLTRNEIGSLGVVGPSMPASCVSASLSAERVESWMSASSTSVRWGDRYEGTREIPDADPRAREWLEYELTRRTPWPAPPESEP